MRHRKSGKKLGRTWEHRKAMFRNMAKSIIVYEKIRTTVPKAKELSKIVDKLITLALRNDLHARRQAYKILENHKLVQRLFDYIGPKFVHGQGGYTRVVKFATPRVGDSAAMAIIEFTYPEAKQKDLPATKPAEAAAPSDKQEVVAAPVETPEESVSQESLPQKDADPEQTEDDEVKAAAPDEISSDTTEPAPDEVSSDTTEPEQSSIAQDETPDKESK